MFQTLVSISLTLIDLILIVSVNAADVQMILNLLTLVVVLTKLGILKITILEKPMNSILKFMVFVFILNFFAYLSSSIQLHNYFFAPMSFLGAYFIFLLLVY